jgi:hypothetical protein
MFYMSIIQVLVDAIVLSAHGILSDRKLEQSWSHAPKLKASIEELQLESTSLKRNKTPNNGYRRCRHRICGWKSDQMQL